MCRARATCDALLCCPAHARLLTLLTCVYAPRACIHTVNSRSQHPTVHACAVVCTCSAEVLPTCDASPETYVYAPWQLETLEQKTTQVTTKEQKPQVSPLNHAPESNHLDTNPTSWPCESNPIPTPDLRLRVDWPKPEPDQSPHRQTSPQPTPQRLTYQPNLRRSPHCSSRPPSSPGQPATLSRAAPRAPCSRSAAASRQRPY